MNRYTFTTHIRGDGSHVTVLLPSGKTMVHVSSHDNPNKWIYDQIHIFEAMNKGGMIDKPEYVVDGEMMICDEQPSTRECIKLLRKMVGVLKHIDKDNSLIDDACELIDRDKRSIATLLVQKCDASC